MNATPCSRCGRPAGDFERPPVAGAEGRELAARICSECWREWQLQEVRVINELRLNFIEPDAQQTLAEHMRRFLGLDGDAPSDEIRGGRPG